MLWRLTRNRYGRALYEWFGDRGITATAMYEYHRAVEGPLPERDPDATIRPLDVGTFTPPPWMDEDRLDDADLVVGALRGGEIVGAVFVGFDRRTRVEALGASVAHEGAYVWRLYVEPRHRGRGLAAGLLAETLRLARDRGAPEAVALVALDNRPSRRTFEALGFEAARVHAYGAAFGREVRRPTARSVPEGD